MFFMQQITIKLSILKADLFENVLQIDFIVLYWILKKLFYVILQFTLNNLNISFGYLKRIKFIISRLTILHC